MSDFEKQISDLETVFVSGENLIEKTFSCTPSRYYAYVDDDSGI